MGKDKQTPPKSPDVVSGQKLNSPGATTATAPAPTFQLQTGAQAPPLPDAEVLLNQPSTKLYADLQKLAGRYNSPEISGDLIPQLAELMSKGILTLKQRELEFMGDTPPKDDLPRLFGVDKWEDSELTVEDLKVCDQYDYWTGLSHAQGYKPGNTHIGYTRGGKGGEYQAANNNQTLAEFKAKIGTNQDKASPAIKAASEWDPKGEVTKNPHFSLTAEELVQAIPMGPKGTQPSPEQMKKIEVYLKHVTQAFRIAKLDTVEAQAVYLAHAAGETYFSILSESQKEKFTSEESEATFNEHDPGGIIRYASHWDPKKKQMVKGLSYGTRYTMDPTGSIQDHLNGGSKNGQTFTDAVSDSFIGRGPIQVSHNFNYLRSLVYLEEFAQTAKGEDARLAWEAIEAIKNDPSQAANEKYSFLFSAVYMHMAGGTRNAGALGDKSARKKAGPGKENQTQVAPKFDFKDGASEWVAGGGRKSPLDNKIKDVNQLVADYELKIAKVEADSSRTAEQKKPELDSLKKHLADYRTHARNAKRKSDTYRAIKDLLLRKLAGKPKK